MLIDQTNVNHTALRDQVAIVTGAGQGIGKEAARILAHLGACVVIAEMNDTGRATEELIRTEGGRALFVQTDVSDPASMEHLRAQVHASFGPVDILVNNAEANIVRPTVENTVEEWDRVFAVNLRGAFLGIKMFLPEMLQRKKGIVITFESAEGMPFMSAYFASKVGLRSLALSLAQEVGEESGVSVYCFGAGMVDTPAANLAAQQNAPLYHITPEDFIRMSAPGGQLISPELCATGLIGTILYAQDFHGEGDAGYVLGLSRLGLDPQGRPWQTEPRGEQPAPVPSSPQAPALATDLYQEAIALNDQLAEVLKSDLKEYDSLSMFQKPIVKRMFQQGTGLKIEGWIASANELTRQLENRAPAKSKLTAYIPQLKRLGDYFQKQESDARGWIKDPEKLRGALEALQQRRETALKLASLLAKLQERG